MSSDLRVGYFDHLVFLSGEANWKSLMFVRIVEEHETVVVHSVIFYKIENLCFNEVLGLATPL